MFTTTLPSWVWQQHNCDWLHRLICCSWESIWNAKLPPFIDQCCHISPAVVIYLGKKLHCGMSISSQFVVIVMKAWRFQWHLQKQMNWSLSYGSLNERCSQSNRITVLIHCQSQAQNSQKEIWGWDVSPHHATWSLLKPRFLQSDHMLKKSCYRRVPFRSSLGWILDFC